MEGSVGGNSSPSVFAVLKPAFKFADDCVGVRNVVTRRRRDILDFWGAVGAWEGLSLRGGIVWGAAMYPHFYLVIASLGFNDRTARGNLSAVRRLDYLINQHGISSGGLRMLGPKVFAPCFKSYEVFSGMAVKEAVAEDRP
jgi:hypothetical protein